MGITGFDGRKKCYKRLSEKQRGSPLLLSDCGSTPHISTKQHRCKLFFHIGAHLNLFNMYRTSSGLGKHEPQPYAGENHLGFQRAPGIYDPWQGGGLYAFLKSASHASCPLSLQSNSKASTDMKLYQMTPAANLLQAKNSQTLLDFYRESHDRLVCRVAELERELIDLKDLQMRGADMASKQSDGLNRLLGDMNIQFPGEGDAA